MNAIEVRDLSKTFHVKQKEKGMRGSLQAVFHPCMKEIRAVEQVSFDVEEGEMLAFLGPNGAGKSTTIKMLTGILYPDGGSMRVLGLDPVQDRRRMTYGIGTVFGQKEQLWTHLTPYDNFRFCGAVYDIPDGEVKERIKNLAEIFEMDGFMHTPVRSLSLGQRIRCEIVSSVLHRPKILFLDEPTIGLDPVVKENVRALIRQMNREFSTTIFLTSHDLGDVEKLCRRILIVNQGRVVLDDSVENLKCHYLNKKIVEVRMREEAILPRAEGITVLEAKGEKMKLEVDTSKMEIGEVLRLIDADRVEDINISNIPLEDIITQIYRSEERGV